MPDMQYKIGYGPNSNLKTTIENGIIDAGDIVFTSDTEECVFIREDKTPMYTKSRTKEDHTVIGGSVGGLNEGDVISSGSSIDDVVQKLTQRRIPAEYKAPEIIIVNNGATPSGAIETGTNITVDISALFTANDAGAITEIIMREGESQISQSTSATCSYTTQNVIVKDGDTSYTATATYEEGAIKEDNLGEESPDGHILAGTITSSPYVITGQRNMFYGTGEGSIPELITSAIVRGLQNKKLNPVAGDSFTMQIPVGHQHVMIAYPNTIKEIEEVYYLEGGTLDITDDFLEVSVQVSDARGGEINPVRYRVYTYEMETPAAAPMTLKFKI